ncbi:hypothetical protein N4G70_26350 [Streptomyces sp. ASQP_92]|nr:hypothetical protein [Streptomyces sp. ASQP_92]MCT9092366.1 hypothetical protein [Streptomyces sp. ASQP_92]
MPITPMALVMLTLLVLAMKAFDTVPPRRTAKPGRESEGAEMGTPR